MKTTGIVRRLDDLGRIVIPVELRRSLGIEERDSLEVLVENERIILRKYSPGCTNCGEIEVYKSVGNIRLCRHCFEDLSGGLA
ncbi:MAG: Transition state regulatory protein AbrB [Firmicutes bacterium]|nr:Transition state regulatory protein AbrB [Bacillota bacterium]